MATRQTEHQLSYLNDQQRLDAVNAILQGCMHLWSKNRLQDGTTYVTVSKKGVRQEHRSEDKLTPMLKVFMELAENDPVFLAHFTSYAMRKLDNADLKVLSVFANSLSSADGTPFSPGSKYTKPNFRVVSQAALQDPFFDAKRAVRLYEIAARKQELGTTRKKAKHLSNSLKTAFKKYLRFRENNPKVLEGVRKVGLKDTYKQLYRLLNLRPTDEAAAILNWNQKGKKIQKIDMFGFKDLDDMQIAQKIREEKLPVTGVLGALMQRGEKKKISPVIAVAILEQCTGNQAVILRELFDEHGLLKHKEVLDLFEQKIQTAKTALDRVERINTAIAEEAQAVLKKAKSDKRKDTVGVVPKLFLHVDISPSMQPAIQLAKDYGSTFAEAIPNPEENFFWGAFNHMGMSLPRPQTFEKDAFHAVLFGLRTSGGTNVMACYEMARKAGAVVDVFITDEGHMPGVSIEGEIDKYERAGLGKPKAVIVIHVDTPDAPRPGYLRNAFESRGIEFVLLKPEALKESALVAQTIRAAIQGQQAILDEIMATPLIPLPKWWDAVKIA